MSSLATSVSGPDLETYLDEIRREVSEEIIRLMPTAKHDGGLYRMVLDYPLRQGKALRPALCLSVNRALGGGTGDALPTAAVLELYHNAFLIHDDVEDGSFQRRNEATLHEKYGIPIAVNVGDAILALAMEPLLDNMAHLGLGRALRILDTTATMARESAEGQSLELDWIFNREDIPNTRDYTRIVYKKTCWYSFIAPLETGAIAAGASSGFLKRLRRFAIHLGIAFQITDDILNLQGEAENYGKEILGDLWEGKYTLMLIHALGCCSKAERRTAQDILSRTRPSAETTPSERIIDQLIETGLLDASCRRQALSAVDEGQVKSADDVRFLRDLIAKYDGLEFAARIASRHSAYASRSWTETFSAVPASVHLEFIESLLDYVLMRRL